MNRRVSVWLAVILAVGAVLAISGLILRATMEVLHGHGAETYVNAQGMQVHWVDVLTLSAAASVPLLALLVATAIFNWRKKRDAALVKKLDAENDAEAANRDE